MKKIFLIAALLVIGLSNLNAQTEAALPQDTCVVMPDSFFLETDMNQIRPAIKCEIGDYKIKIYDSFGELLFESEDVLEFWDVDGFAAGTYFWTISGNLTNALPILPIKKQGYILLTE
ncbi:hypothetical protein N8987_04220 [Crocinitomix sp.]|nr:hypothetical protein [Crocinitomix sp.]